VPASGIRNPGFCGKLNWTATPHASKGEVSSMTIVRPSYKFFGAISELEWEGTEGLHITGQEIREIMSRGEGRQLDDVSTSFIRYYEAYGLGDKASMNLRIISSYATSTPKGYSPSSTSMQNQCIHHPNAIAMQRRVVENRICSPSTVHKSRAAAQNREIVNEVTTPCSH
jgi:hypothetical protein